MQKATRQALRSQGASNVDLKAIPEDVIYACKEMHSWVGENVPLPIKFRLHPVTRSHPCNTLGIKFTYEVIIL